MFLLSFIFNLIILQNNYLHYKIIIHFGFIPFFFILVWYCQFDVSPVNYSDSDSDSNIFRGTVSFIRGN